MCVIASVRFHAWGCKMGKITFRVRHAIINIALDSLGFDSAVQDPCNLLKILTLSILGRRRLSLAFLRHFSLLSFLEFDVVSVRFSDCTLTAHQTMDPI